MKILKWDIKTKKMIPVENDQIKKNGMQDKNFTKIGNVGMKAQRKVTELKTTKYGDVAYLGGDV